MIESNWEPGDETLAVCNACAAMVSATYRVRDVPFEDGSGAASGILVAVCDQCDDVCCIPAQSAPATWNDRHKFGKILIEVPFRQVAE